MFILYKDSALQYEVLRQFIKIQPAITFASKNEESEIRITFSDVLLTNTANRSIRGHSNRKRTGTGCTESSSYTSK